MRITEIKRHADGSEHRYACELVLRRRHVVVVQFDHWGARSDGGFDVPAGSRTHGFFWPRRAYSLYRIAGPDRALIAHRFDVLEDCRAGEDEVSYLDLLLDIWVAPDGTATVEDEEDVMAWHEAGLLSDAQLSRIERTKGLLLRSNPSITREAARLIERA